MDSTFHNEEFERHLYTLRILKVATAFQIKGHVSSLVNQFNFNMCCFLFSFISLNFLFLLLSCLLSQKLLCLICDIIEFSTQLCVHPVCVPQGPQPESAMLSQ